MKKFKNIAYDAAFIFLRDNNIIEEIKNSSTNSKYLGDITLPSNIVPCNKLSAILDQEVIIIAVPSFAFHDTLNILKNTGISKDVTLLVATKGFSRDTTELLSDKVKKILPNNPLAFIAGSNLAKEVAQNLLSSVTIASVNIDLARRLAISLISQQFKVTVTDYVVAIQVASAVKNIVTIKGGWYEAKGYGQNAKAGLITGGFKK
jgi:glycerol-3-phosphate dehydrogenase (NAD(P)+)